MGHQFSFKPSEARRARWRLRAVIAVCLGIVGPIAHSVEAQDILGAGSYIGRPETGRLPADQQRDLDLLLGVLRDTKIDLAKRRGAAESLLARAWPAGIEAMARQLADATDPAGQRAVAAAVAGVAGDFPPRSLAEPLVNLLGVDNDPLRRDVALALSRYEDGPVVARLITLAQNPTQPLNVRIGAIGVLGELRRPDSAQALVLLTESGHDRAIRNAAFQALEELSGNAQIGPDTVGWHDWWQAHRNLPRDRWLGQLVRSLSQQERRLAGEQAMLMARLAETYGQLYVATPEADRPAMLIKMLDDPITSVRLAALHLVERNLLNAQSPSQPVREKLRTRLDDDSPLVRASAASLLRDIDDDPAADYVVTRLLAENDPAAVNAYLSLLARKPRQAAVDPTLVLAGRSETRAAAAGMLIACLDANLLQPRQRAAAMRQARSAIKDKDSPDPAMVKLLARLVPPDAAEAANDRAMIEALLGHSEPAVRRAAAEAYVSGSLEISPLLAHIDDPTLGARALEAAGRRGTSLDVATFLLDHPPQQKELEPAWRAALQSVAGRLDCPALRKLDDVMIARTAAPELRIAMLKGVMDRKDEPLSASRNTLLLRLGRLLLDSDQAATAKAAYEAVDESHADAPQLHQRDRGLLEALLRTTQDDAAMTLATQVSQQDDDGALVVRSLLLDAADAALATKRTEQAGLWLAKVAQLTTPQTPADQQGRLKALLAKLAAAQQTPAPGTPAPTPGTTPTPIPPTEAIAPAPANPG